MSTAKQLSQKTTTLTLELWCHALFRSLTNVVHTHIAIVMAKESDRDSAKSIKHSVIEVACRASVNWNMKCDK